MLEVNGLTVMFGGLVAVKELSFTVAAGEVCAIVGPNGAGKTTVFNAITGFAPVQVRLGPIRWEGDFGPSSASDCRLRHRQDFPA